MKKRSTKHIDDLLKQRYFFQEETWEELCQRVARTVSMAEKTREKRNYWYERFYNTLVNKYFLPNSPVLWGAGIPKQTLSACFVIGIEDNIKGIMETLSRTVAIFKAGGGVGINFSNLRPNGLDISAGGKSSGPLAFLELFDTAGEVIKQGGRRRSAQMSVLNCDHMDIMEFINAKSVPGKFTNMNLSVAVTNKFMEAVELDDLWEMKYNNYSKYIKAREIFNAICKRAWESGEPGLLFLDRVNEDDPNPKYGDIDCMNPCLTGDTIVACADGKGDRTIKELAISGEDIPVYCINNKGKINISKMVHPRITGKKQPIYKITFDDGNSIRVTENHKFLLKSGKYKETKELKKNDSLQIMNKVKMGYEELIKNRKNNSNDYIFVGLDRIYKPEHRLIYKFYNNNENIPTGKIIHHKDHNTFNNNIKNLEIMDRKEHDKLHGEEMFGKNNPMFKLKETGGEKYNEYCKNMSKLMSGKGNNNYSGITNEQIKNHARILTQKLNRRFSEKEWKKYAKENNLIYNFNKFRHEDFDTVCSLSKLIAKELGVDNIDEDPRIVKTYQKMINMGYNSIIKNNKVFITKFCEYCGKEFCLPSERREVCYCSTSCSQKNFVKNNRVKYEKILLNRKHKIEEIKENKRKIQIEIFLDLKNELERIPFRKEWENRCKSKNISFRFGKSSPFLNFEDLKEQSKVYNHRIVKIEFDGYEDVYNGTVESYHNFFVGGFKNIINGKETIQYINNLQCGEQPLKNDQSCSLASINLDKLVKENKTTDWQLFEELIQIVIRFLDNTIDVNYFPDDKIDNMVKMTRPIGLGIMGFADYLVRRNIKYGSEKSLKELGRILQVMKSFAKLTSSNLGQEKGSFPCFLESKWAQEGCKWLRNSQLLSIAPTGSISKIADCSPGIEPIFTFANESRPVTGSSEPMVIESKWKDFQGDRNILVSGDEIPWQEHLEILATAQKYVDTGISKTIALPYETTVEDVKNIYMTAWSKGCKGITVFRKDNGEREGLIKELCPEHNVELIRQGRCSVCPVCGWSNRCSL